MNPWEIHPALVHFPIAFLLAGVTLDLFAWMRGRDDLGRIVGGLFIAGVVTGWLTAATGLLAYYTVPAHTEEAHGLMTWHLGLNAAMLVLFTGLVLARRRRGMPTLPLRAVGLVATVLLLVAGYLGGYIVYHGGAGVAPAILAPEIREGHSHRGSHEHGGAPAEHKRDEPGGHRHEGESGS